MEVKSIDYEAEELATGSPESMTFELGILGEDTCDNCVRSTACHLGLRRVAVEHIKRWIRGQEEIMAEQEAIDEYDEFKQRNW